MDQEHWVSLVGWFWFRIGQGCSLIWRHNCIYMYMCVCVCVCVCMCVFWIFAVQSPGHVQLIASPRTAAYQAPLSFTISQYQFSTVTQLCSTLLTPWTAAHQTSLSITNSWSLLKLMSIELVIPSNHLILCHPLLFLPSVFPRIWVFSNESTLHIRWPKYRSFNFSISPSNENSGLISFRMDWLNLLAVQGTLKSLLQHHISKASIRWRSTFSVV